MNGWMGDVNGWMDGWLGECYIYYIIITTATYVLEAVHTLSFPFLSTPSRNSIEHLLFKCNRAQKQPMPLPSGSLQCSGDLF